MDNGLDISMNVPHVAPPNLIFSEIEAELVPGSKE
jgi:hypothetical protein